MVKSWNDRLNMPGINGIKPSPRTVGDAGTPTTGRLSFGARFVAAQRKREGLKP